MSRECPSSGGKLFNNCQRHVATVSFDVHLQSWTNVLGTLMLYSFFSLISGCPRKTVQPCWEYLAMFSPQRIQCWNSRKILDTRVQRCLWGATRSWKYEIWGKLQKRLCVPRLLPVLVALWTFGSCLLWVTHYCVTIHCKPLTIITRASQVLCCARTQYSCLFLTWDPDLNACCLFRSTRSKVKWNAWGLN